MLIFVPGQSLAGNRWLHILQHFVGQRIDVAVN
jgi:hypothetical protein